MSQRIVVSPACETTCFACISCHPGDAEPSLDEVIEASLKEGATDLMLGGGDATRWSFLRPFLDENARRASPQRVWLEAPARSLTKSVLSDLAGHGLFGVRVQIEGVGATMMRVHGIGDGEQVIADAESLGLGTEARLSVRPMTFAMVVPLAQRLRPRTVWLEIIRQDRGKAPVTMPPAAVEKTLLGSGNLNFAAHRLSNTGYLPPCVMPNMLRTRPTAWRTTQGKRATPNDALAICAECSMNLACQWNDPAALSDEALAAAQPVRNIREQHRASETAVPEIIVRQRPVDGDVLCVTPWTTMEVVDPDGRVRQCCSTWTSGDRGNVHGSSLSDVWNGAGYRQARRVMSGRELSSLCNPVCSRLHDRKLEERSFRIQSGGELFVKNQLLMAEDIAQRREEVRSKPLHIALCPSTYCNYDCIMCDLGYLPRRDLPEAIWDELPRFLPTLRTLTLLGGEPLANPRTWEFLREFDTTRYPDASLDLVTNGSLLTEKALERIARCALGDVTISLNAGDAETYTIVQSPTISFESVIQNLDALIRFRDARPWWFGITLSFVVQAASAHSLVAFAEIAHARNLRVRFMAVNPENHEHLDFYRNPDEVARVLEHVNRFIAWCEHVRPEWSNEARGVRQAVIEEASRRQSDVASGLVQLRPASKRPPQKNLGKVLAVPAATSAGTATPSGPSGH